MEEWDSKSAVGISVQRDLNATNVSVQQCFYSQPEAPATIRSFQQVDDPTDFLTSRQHIIDRLHDQLKDCFTKASCLHRTVVLHGMGGIGKSELARMYASTYRNDKIIQNVAWINAERESSLKASFELLATKLKLTIEPSDIEITVQNIYQHFSENIETGLFIFDNAPQMKKTENEFGIYDFLPKQFYKKRPLVLITSRNNEWQRIPAENKIEVEELSTEEAIEFLTNGLELTDQQKRDENVNTAIRCLADNLRGYTLALVLATSNIHNTTWGDKIESRIAKYVTRMNVPRGGWPQDKHSKGAATTYNLIMSNVWSATFDEIASLGDEGKNALQLLNYTAFLPTDGIIVQKLCDIFNFSHPQSCDEQSFVLLEKYSLIKIISDTDSDCDRVRIHRLVQHCARDKLDCDKDFTSLFRICNYLTAQKEDDFDFEELKSCMHEHLTQRSWPGDSIKYPIIFGSLAIWYFREIHFGYNLSNHKSLSTGSQYILAAKSFLDLQNQNSSYVAPLKNVFDLLHLCLAYSFTRSYNHDEVFRDPSIRTKLKEVILLYEKDYIRYLVEGSADNVCEEEKQSDFVTEPCYRVCHKILTERVEIVSNEFGIEFQIFENLVDHLNSSDQRPDEIVAVKKVHDLLWAHLKSACPVSAVQAIKCAVKKHRQLQPTLILATNSEKHKYWLHGGPFVHSEILRRMSDADWSRAFVDAFFDEGGPEIIGQHLTYLSTSHDQHNFNSDFIDLTGLIMKLGSQCSSKLIRDADFMESLLVFSKHVLGAPYGDLSFHKAECLIIWFTLFEHNETVADSRGRSWSINDVTHEISLLLTFDHSDIAIHCVFERNVRMFENFLEATKDEPESAAMKLAKQVVASVEEIRRISVEF